MSPLRGFCVALLIMLDACQIYEFGARIYQLCRSETRKLEIQDDDVISVMRFLWCEKHHYIR